MHIEFLVEELSAETALQILVPKIIGEVPFRIHPFQGKLDLLRQLSKRLAGYSSWIPPDWRVVVLVDRDEDDCHELKSEMQRRDTLACARGSRSRNSKPGFSGM